MGDNNPAQDAQGQPALPVPAPGAQQLHPPPPPLPAAAPTAPSSKLSHPAILSLSGTMFSFFGRQANTYLTYDYAVQIAGQNTISSMTYDQLEQLVNADLPINRDDFIHMWKTIILKRCQDIFEKKKYTRADHFARIDRTILTPAPLSDFLYSVGSFSSVARGIHIHMTPPAHAAPAPNWWTADNGILTNWNFLCHRMKALYTFRDYPSPTDFESRPLALLTILDKQDNAVRSVHSYTNEPSASDAYVRFCHDELFVAYNGIANNVNTYLIVDRDHRTAIVGSYIVSYASNS